MTGASLACALDRSGLQSENAARLMNRAAFLGKPGRLTSAENPADDGAFVGDVRMGITLRCAQGPMPHRLHNHLLADARLREFVAVTVAQFMKDAAR